MNELPEEQPEKDVIISPDGDFKKFFEKKFDTFEEEYTIKLYRISKAMKGRTYKTYLKKFVCHVPDEDEIGEEFGGGHFWCVSNDLPGKIAVEKSIWIDEIFTKRIESKNMVNHGYPREPSPMEPPPPVQDPLESMGKLLKMIAPILQAGGKSNEGPGVATMMEGMADAFTKGMTKIQGALIDKQLDKMDEPAPENDQEKLSTVREIVGLIREFGGPILNSSGIKQSIMKTAIKSDENFQKVKDDPDLIDAIYTMACEDPEIGQDKIDKVFEKLGFTQPEPVEETTNKDT